MRPERAHALSRRGTRTLVELADDYAHTYAPLYPDSGKGGRSQLPASREMAHARAHPSAARW
jgi:hypothetical protein